MWVIKWKNEYLVDVTNEGYCFFSEDINKAKRFKTELIASDMLFYLPKSAYKIICIKES